MGLVDNYGLKNSWCKASLADGLSFGFILSKYLMKCLKVLCSLRMMSYT